MTRRPQMQPDLLPGCDVENPNAKIADANTPSSSSRTPCDKIYFTDRKTPVPDPLKFAIDDKIDTDQGGSDVPLTPNQVLLLGCDKIDFGCPRLISSSRSPV